MMTVRLEQNENDLLDDILITEIVRVYQVVQQHCDECKKRRDFVGCGTCHLNQIGGVKCTQ